MANIRRSISANLEAGMSSDDVFRGEYRVFPSFRGPDSRHGFTNCLCHGLVDVGFRVSRDHGELRVGKKMKQELPCAIENSIIYLASGHWCLRELTVMVQQTSKSQGLKEILPIFFDVEDVKLKTAFFRDAILKLEQEQKLSIVEVEACRKALQEVDELKRWNLKKDDGHRGLIKLVVGVVLHKLKTIHKSVTEHLVGMNDGVADLRKLLAIEASGFWLAIAHGMRGIGKTTLAKVVLNQLLPHSGMCSSFLDDIQEKVIKR
ncbi:disease resistance protein L6-like [Syzygium oleosum]|uniref:disease resistance protein L6-like n=1 Tax=Syzygium oleosum TaxID=219896 RepID=UPI0024BB2E6D|nr:disease resistance protein L6-like [Syzygium oleosum]